MTLPVEKRPHLDALNEGGEPSKPSKATSTQMPSVERGVESISLEDIVPLSTTSEATDEVMGLSETTSAAHKKKARKSTIGTTQKLDPSEPRIITLDSLGKAHSPTCRTLKDYLAEEAKDKKGAELSTNPSGMTGKGIPEQDNFCDCGVFVLGYMEAFLRDPDDTYRRLLHKEHVDWNINPSQLRIQIRELLFKLQEEQQERIEREREVKRAARLEKKGSVTPSRQSRPPIQRASSQGPIVGHTTPGATKPASPTLLPKLSDIDNAHGLRLQTSTSSPAKIPQPKSPAAGFSRPPPVRPLPESSSDTGTDRLDWAHSSKTKQSKLSNLTNGGPPKLVSPLADSSLGSAGGDGHTPVSPDATSAKMRGLEPKKKTLAREPVQDSVEVSDEEITEVKSPRRHGDKKRKKKKVRNHESSSRLDIDNMASERVASDSPQYDGIYRPNDGSI